MACLLAGCAAGPRIDWNRRIGNYTYNQAVQEMGVPEKTTKLRDSAMEVEWLVSSYSPAIIRSGGDTFVGQPDWVAPDMVTAYPGGPDAGRWLRLVFAPDGALRSWKHFHR